MRKLIVCAIILIMQFAHGISKAEIATPQYTESATSSLSNIKLLNRINEIETMDKPTLNSSEKRALRKELREKRTQAHGGRTIYISVGVLLIVILILLLI